MNKREIQKRERILNALQAFGICLFRCESCDPKWDAQQNLSRRTHYVDENTLKYFKARINNCWRPCLDSEQGLILAIAESVASKPNDLPGGNKRVTVFDCMGEVIHQTEWCNTTKQAEKEFYEWFEGFDTLKHYTDKLRGMIRRKRKEATRASNALLGRKAK